MVQNISVVIPTYNRHKTLVETVRSLCSGTVVPKQIVIVDQSDTPISLDCFPKFSLTEVLVFSEKTKSATHARNVGIKNSKENIILFCDDDILLGKYSLEIMWSEICKPDIALVSAIHYENNGLQTTQTRNIVKEIAGTILGMKKCWRNDGYVIKSNLRGRYSTNIKKTTNTEWAMGYFFCVKREILKCMDHWFDEKLVRYSYAEDLDLTYRYCLIAKQKGYKTVVCPDIYINHLASQEWRIPKKEEVLYIFANRRYLQFKLFPQKKIYRLAMCIYDRLYELSQIRNKEYCCMIHTALKICAKNKNNIQRGEISQLVIQLK